MIDAMQNLSTLATVYERQVDQLPPSIDSPNAPAALACLILRDQVAYQMTEAGPPDPETAQHIITADQQLRRRLPIIRGLPELPAWRQSFNPPAEAWWWPEPPARPRFNERFNWLWTALALAFLAVALSLIADIASRFLSGNTDAYGILAIVGPTLLTLFTTRSVLTEAGQKAIQRMLSGFKFIPAGWREELGLAASIGLVIAMALFWFSLPAIAKSYHDNGLAQYGRGEFTAAKASYERALALDANLIETHYNLGVLYEDLNQPDQAKTEYQLAVQGSKLDAAYNNLARLYILDNDFDTAVPLLLTITTENLAKDHKVKYDTYKNLGWARLGQTRYPEAQAALNKAIDIDPDRAPAYCLLAQVYTGQEADAGQIKTAWESCLAFADLTKPDEDGWVGQARHYFETQPGGYHE
ncbi:MAG: tetratricopeptide repeat protein [Anaerolineae bacterium]|nr:tetratricopeptide repeat protein [Anaerolineae bacterium]